MMNRWLPVEFRNPNGQPAKRSGYPGRPPKPVSGQILVCGSR